jgi:hypothetical protein
MKHQRKLILTGIALVVLASLVLLVATEAFNIGPFASYGCPNPDPSVYSMCRVFTQEGTAPISVASNGDVLSDLLVRGVPAGSTALFTHNGEIIIRFVNGSSMTCYTNRGDQGPCIIGIV